MIRRKKRKSSIKNVTYIIKTIPKLVTNVERTKLKSKCPLYEAYFLGFFTRNQISVIILVILSFVCVSIGAVGCGQ